MAISDRCEGGDGLLEGTLFVNDLFSAFHANLELVSVP